MIYLDFYIRRLPSAVCLIVYEIVEERVGDEDLEEDFSHYDFPVAGGPQIVISRNEVLGEQPFEIDQMSADQRYDMKKVEGEGYPHYDLDCSAVFVRAGQIVDHVVVVLFVGYQEKA